MHTKFPAQFCSALDYYNGMVKHLAFKAVDLYLSQNSSRSTLLNNLLIHALHKSNIKAVVCDYFLLKLSLQSDSRIRYRSAVCGST